MNFDKSLIMPIIRDIEMKLDAHIYGIRINSRNETTELFLRYLNRKLVLSITLVHDVIRHIALYK